MIKTTYICDQCGAEQSAALTAIKCEAQRGDRMNKDAQRQVIANDMCEACFTRFIDAVQEFKGMTRLEQFKNFRPAKGEYQ